MNRMIVVIENPLNNASIAQWLEHWSCKPGVRGSNPRRGSLFFFRFEFMGSKFEIL